jgi:hypothetical protein
MPCRCCGASRPSKGFKEPGESKINDLLKEASHLIFKHHEGRPEQDDLTYWKKGWQEAFDHHLNGCKVIKDKPCQEYQS